jgi:ankyrin repeat protein
VAHWPCLALDAPRCPRLHIDGDVARVSSYLTTGKGTVNDRFDEGHCSGCTLLHYAAGNSDDQVAVAKLLVEGGADVNASESRHLTPLHVACTNQNPALVRYLLANGAGAALETRDDWGNTPLLLAVAYVKERERTVFTPVGAVFGSQRASGPSEEIVVSLLDAGANVNATTAKGNTALHIAAYKGYSQMVRLLLSRGADRTSRNPHGQTPEMLAEEYKQSEVLRVLREPRAH